MTRSLNWSRVHRTAHIRRLPVSRTRTSAANSLSQKMSPHRDAWQYLTFSGFRIIVDKKCEHWTLSKQHCYCQHYHNDERCDGGLHVVDASSYEYDGLTDCDVMSCAWRLVDVDEVERSVSWRWSHGRGRARGSCVSQEPMCRDQDHVFCEWQTDELIARPLNAINRRALV